MFNPIQNPMGFIITITVLTLGFIVVAFVVGIGLSRRLMRPNQDVLKTGLSGQATVLQVWQTGLQVNDQPQVGMLLQIEVPGYESYQVEHKMVVPIIHIPQFQPGVTLPVRVDPANLKRIALDVYA